MRTILVAAQKIVQGDALVLIELKFGDGSWPQLPNQRDQGFEEILSEPWIFPVHRDLDAVHFAVREFSRQSNDLRGLFARDDAILAHQFGDDPSDRIDRLYCGIRFRGGAEVERISGGKRHSRSVQLGRKTNMHKAGSTSFPEILEAFSKSLPNLTALLLTSRTMRNQLCIVGGL